jgi:FixJ family two-component response regulator
MMNAQPAIIYVVDDEEAMIRALQRLLRAEGYEVRGFRSALEFLEGFHPGDDSCLLLDVAMPGLDGLNLQERLSHEGILLPIVFLSGYADIPITVKAMKGGAVDFLTKPVEREPLLRAVRAALARAADQRALAAFARRLSLLTPREREVLTHVVTGKLNKQIAADLGTGEQNIKIHRGRVMHKLGVESLAELVRRTERLGLASSEAEASPAPR